MFILDGFDELPSSLRHSGLMIDLITGHALPKSAVIVTSRPSATTDLLRSCSPQVQRHIEILGFTQECVKEYASSVFSSEPKLLDDFLTFISASSNPAINSLMYIPLNAAIIVELYRNSRRTGTPVPNTLTQLYTQLCLTLLQRHYNNQHPLSDVILNQFTNLNNSDYHHFLELSKIAFEGFMKSEVIFFSDSLPRDLVHFGFLDTTLSLHCGGGVSHNFLHFTLQEFLTAYYISQLPHQDGLEVFQQHATDKRWNMVWRFLAGLTGFEYYKGTINCDAFVTIKENKLELSSLLIQCVYEACIKLDYTGLFGSKEISAKGVENAIEKCALGYCIAASASTVSWDVKLYGSLDGFIWGLNSRPCEGIITTIEIIGYSQACDYMKFPPNVLQGITSLDVTLFNTTDASVSNLIALISQMKILKNLSIDGVQHAKDLTKLLFQLSTSNVTSLDLKGLFEYRNLNRSVIDALVKLIDESHGKLLALNIIVFLELSLNLFAPDVPLSELVFSNSSLWQLCITSHNRLIPLTPLETNTCLTHVTIECEWLDWHAKSIACVLQKNTTLQHLILKPSSDYLEGAIHFCITVANGLKMNLYLQTVELHVPSGMKPQDHPEFNSDSRIILCVHEI